MSVATYIEYRHKQLAEKRAKRRFRRRRAKTTPAISRLKALIWTEVWGEKTEVGVRPCKTIEQYIRHGGYGLSNIAIVDHVHNKRTLYFMGRPDADEQLFKIDVDVLKKGGRGTVAGGLAYQQYVADRLPFKAHWEASTNGNGRHGYGILDCRLPDGTRATPERIKAALYHLQAYLRYLKQASGADIEEVEVKGHPPIIKRKPFERVHHRSFLSVQYAQFAKIPRDIEALLRLEPISIEAIEALVIPEVYAVKATAKSTAGSCSGNLITPEDLARLPALTAIGAEILGQQLNADGCSRRRIKAHRWAVTPDDIGIALLILTYLQENPNEDGTQPTARIKGMWQALYDAGDVSRAWNNARWACIRNTLSAAGLLNWADHRYAKGVVACKWCLTSLFYELLTSVPQHETKTGGASLIYTRLLETFLDLPRTGQNLSPRRMYGWEAEETEEDREFAAWMAA